MFSTSKSSGEMDGVDGNDDLHLHGMESKRMPKSIAMENPRASFGSEHEKAADRAANTQNEETAQARRRRRMVGLDQASCMVRKQPYYREEELERHYYSPSTGSVFILDVC